MLLKSTISALYSTSPLDSQPAQKHHAVMSELDDIVADIESAEAGRSKSRLWAPTEVGEIDIRIGADGSWYHEGRLFRKAALVKLFAGILQRQNSNYYLVTPVEKLKIQVDDAPFVATLVEAVRQDDQSAIVFTTNIGDRIILDDNHPVRVETDPQTQHPRPYILVRDGLEALISRSAYYDLICLAEEQHRDDKICFTISSLGHCFELGCVNASERE